MHKIHANKHSDKSKSKSKFETVTEDTATPVYHPKLTVILIAHNEEKNIIDCLESVAFAQEWIVVDGGSTDKTTILAQEWGAKVTIHRKWEGFGVQKNRALALATQDWVLSIDCDERVPPQLAKEIQEALAFEALNAELNPKQACQKNSTTTVTCAFLLPRSTQFCGTWIRHCGWTPDLVLRLFKRGDAQFTNDMVHERLYLSSVLVEEKPKIPKIHRSIKKLKIPLQHHSYPTPAVYWRKLEQYSQAWANQRHAEGKGKHGSMWRAGFSAATAFLRSYVFQLGFLDGAMGFAVCVLQAQAAFGKYFTLYCLHNQKINHKTSNGMNGKPPRKT